VTGAPKGPYTLWLDYGYEGWIPKDFATLEEAISAERHTHAWVITKAVKFSVSEEGEAE
jgi:hypothetical protein